MRNKYFLTVLCGVLLMVCLAGCATKPCADPDTCMCRHIRGGYHDEQGNYNISGPGPIVDIPDKIIYRRNKHGESVPYVYREDTDEWVVCPNYY